MAQLQKPEFVYMGGALRRLEEAVLHVGCEGVIAVDVLEGSRGTGNRTDSSASSAQTPLCTTVPVRRLLHIPFDHSFNQYRDVNL